MTTKYTDKGSDSPCEKTLQICPTNQYLPQQVYNTPLSIDLVTSVRALIMTMKPVLQDSEPFNNASIFLITITHTRKCIFLTLSFAAEYSFGKILFVSIRFLL